MKALPLIKLLRRASHSKYSKVILNNRMLMQCYSISADSDIGLHYSLFIPPTEEYEDEFYDKTVILNINEITVSYNTMHKILLEEKKERKAKAKDVKEECMFVENNNKTYLSFIGYIEDEIISSQKYYIENYPVSDTNQEVINCTEAYTSLIERIKPGGCCVILDGIKNGMFTRALHSIQVDFYKVKINGKTIKIPLIKSLLAGNKDLDSFYVSLQESTILDVYIYALQLSKKGITDTFFGYIQNF